RRLRWVFDPGEDDDLVPFCFYRALKVSDFAIRHVIAPRFDHADCAELLEQRCGIGRMLDIGRLVGGRHCGNKTLNIRHGTLLSLNESPFADRRTVLQVPLTANGGFHSSRVAASTQTLTISA